MIITIKRLWWRPVIALLSATVLILPTLLPSGGLVPKAEAATIDIITNTTWTEDKTIGSDDVVNIVPGVTLTIMSVVSNYGEINVHGILNLVTSNDPNVLPGRLLVYGGVYGNGIVNVKPGGSIGVFSGDNQLGLFGTMNVDGIVNVKPGGSIGVFSPVSILNVNLGGTLNVDGRVEVFGTVDVNPGGTLNVNLYGTVDVYSEIGAVSVWSDTGELNVYGTVDVQPGGTLNLAGEGYTLNVKSGGTLNVDGKLTVGDYFGILDVNFGGVLSVSRHAIVYNTASGIIHINGALYINTFARLDNIGILNINNYGILETFSGSALHNTGTIHKQCRGTFTLKPGASYTGNPIESDPCIAINDVSLTENNSGTKNFVFKVTRSGGTTGTTTVNYATPPRTFPPFPTPPGTARPGDDYVSKSGTLTFTSGQTTMTISIAVKGDTIVEPDEEFIVRLSNCSSTGCIIIDGKGVGTIRNDDS